MFKLNWKKYSNFFSLYEECLDEQVLLYVIGETKEVYIGCVGIRGKNGLRQRYQKPYINRAISIFGTNLPDDQPAYAANIIEPKESCNLLLDLEEIIQNCCVNDENTQSIKFKKRKKHVPYEVISTGEKPPWLPNKIDA